MVFKNLCIFVLWTNVAVALEGLRIFSNIIVLVHGYMYIYVDTL